MSKAKIGIVEDDLFTGTYTKHILEDLNYCVPEPCTNYEDAIKMMEIEKPDLVILDIQLLGDLDGIVLAEYIAEKVDIPFIFHSANDDEATIQRVKKVKPHAFLTKPFKKTDLMVAIENAIDNYCFPTTSNAAVITDNYIIKDSFFVKDGHYFHKINFDDVLYIESVGAYVSLFTEQKKYLLRGSIQQHLEKMNSNKYFRVHRSYAVNLDKVEFINSAYVTINNQQIPISKNFRENLLASLKIL